MEAKARRQWQLLGALLLLLSAAFWWNTGGGQAPVAGPERGRAAAPAARDGRPADGGPAPVEPVALTALQAPAPEPVAAGRNPFRFQSPAAPRPPDEEAQPGGRGDPEGAPVGGASVQAPGGPPPIPLRFIGVVDEVARHLKLAVLSDGRNVFYGREGDIIEGRYRIVRIGVESIEMIHVDGRGQQTIRLSGS